MTFGNGEQNLNILSGKYLRLKIHYKFDFPAKNLKRVFSFLFFRACVDIVHFVGLPSAAFCVFKKLSRCSVGLIEDPEILNTVLSGIRGGMRYFFFLKLPTSNKCVHFFHF